MNPECKGLFFVPIADKIPPRAEKEEVIAITFNLQQPRAER
jgi:hypothetical protein